MSIPIEPTREEGQYKFDKSPIINIPIMTNPRANNETNHPLIMHAFLSHEELLDTCMRNESFITSIQRAADIMIASLKNGGKIIACGNGGSMSDAMHFCAELTGRLKDSRAPIPAIAISDAAHISCVANDFGYEKVFSRYIDSVMMEDDVLLAITTSGNSANIIHGISSVHGRRGRVVLLSGNNGGNTETCLRKWGDADLDDHSVIVPGKHSSGDIQQIHIIVIHILCGLIEKGILPS